MKKLALTLSLALLSGALAAPLLARESEPVSVAVQSRDLDLSSDAGVQTLYTRIHAAARKACAGAESRSAASQVEHRMCMRTAMDSGVLAANNAALSKLHAEKTGSAGAVVADR
jgi:UrcA family protein